MCQSNALLRARKWQCFANSCLDRDFKIRWAGIKSLGHACCTIGSRILNRMGVLIHNRCKWRQRVRRKVLLTRNEFIRNRRN